MHIHPKQVNLRLKSSAYIHSDIYKNCNDANLILFYKSKVLQNKLDKILNNIQIRQRNLLYHNLSHRLYDNKDLASSFPSIPISPTTRQYFNLDGSELETASLQTDKKKENILNVYNYKKITKQNNNLINHYDLSNKFKRSNSIVDFNNNSTFHILNNSQLNVNKINKVKPNWRAIKMKSSGSKRSQVIKRNLSQELKIRKADTSNIDLSMNNSNIFGNVFLQRKFFDK